MKDGKPETGREAQWLRDVFLLGAQHAVIAATGRDIDAHEHGSLRRELQDQAKCRYPTPTRVVCNTAEDPECKGWYWRVRDTQLEVNFIHDDETMEEFWEPYNLEHTPGLKPTAERLRVWRELYLDPTRLEPIL